MDSGSALTPTALLARVREVDRLRRAADLELLELAVAWADAHPDPHELADPVTASGCVDAESLDALGNERAAPDMWRGLPGIAWDAAAALGTALSRSTGSAERLIRDGLILRHRLPRHWAQVQDGSIEAFRARRVADLVAGHPDDVCAYVDEHVAPIAATAGLVTLDRILDGALLTLHADQVELDRLEALEARHVTVDKDSINHTGVADLSARADWADLADPARAQALLEGSRTPARTRRTDLMLHLDTDALQNRSFFGRDGRLDKAVVADAVRDWCGRSDMDLHVHPVIDLNEHGRVEQHDAPATMQARIELTHPTCVFPWCTRSARRCDKDHRVPYDAGGATCDCNLAPLCRRHHRLKTHRGYSYTIIEPATWLWRTPHGLQLIRDRGRTRDVTPDPPPGGSDQTWDGCLAVLG